ncbi:NAD-dependent protein deacetylase sirtuin-2 [Armadillidium nasatum]|uniref:NAD-dependent protein deacetylase sirtuin-2 n=1 Tax=Armadillidium nasatum TaxID=96803 RepID=A0A5N5STJ1_9CRUS|nr:NAD-dependent protein deacetylase sirtuin-2 [Armadillidium nasatum]
MTDTHEEITDASKNVDYDVKPELSKEGTSDDHSESPDPNEEPSDATEEAEGEDDKNGWFENLKAKCLKFYSSFVSKLNPKDKEVLDEVSVDGVVSYIKSGKCKNIITLAGAGISTSAGIPDFRSPQSGLYHNLKKYDLPYPEAIFDIEYFKLNPKPFYVLAKELYPGEFIPTPSHYFVKLLHDKGLLLRHYTQNIDTLEHIAGIPVEKLVEAHGTFRTSHCLKCKKEYSQEWVKDEIFADRIPTCIVCQGVVKPDIVLFREGLPRRFYELSSIDFKHCDLLIIMGTSLTVQPFASLVDNVSASCPRLLINRDDVGLTETRNVFQQLFGGAVRDVVLKGDCDDGCKSLVNKLGWTSDFEALLSGPKS